ncbi:L-iditol 2-dehydrogenase [Halogranum rubrum]|uniref:L-iditol 2-dehydrogenase n=1 Tax=Halogranum rubrum TaxID=553466 RepID=A0A1I4GV06_9EURY|nr:alcohol dehydrogenase catalytic domain-containing protein [Halogranum rubrum]SFL33759.1 L-iditol 2-dehydrogenase [Halogranum rubrum]
MKQIVQTGPEAVEVQEGEQPTPGPNEVLVRVHTAGLCGSDAHAYKYEGGYEWIPIPRIMGHEYSGEVVEVGDQVTSIREGQRVVEEPIHHCGECFQCRNGQENVCQNFSITGMHRDGAYAEYTVVEPHHLHPIPDSVSLSHAAITEPTSIATRAVFSQSDVTPGDQVLVEGPGPIGVLVASIADSMGANVLLSGLGQDAKSRLPQMRRLGIDTIDVESHSLEDEVDSRTNGGGFDVVFDTTGHRSGVETGIDVTRKGGQVVVVGLPGEPSNVFMTPVVRGEIDINTSYGSTWSNFEQALRLMENGTIDADDIVDTSFSTSNPARAFEAFLNSEVIKPVFSFAD